MQARPSTELTLGGPVATALMHNFSEVERFFPYNPYDPAAWRARQAEIARSYRTDRAALTQLLTAYNERLGASPAALRSLQRLAEPEALVVVAGQQAGLFTGPLYTIYKALTVVHLARKAEAELGVPVVPLFWVASEDHDFVEINRVDVIGRDGRRMRLALPDQPDGRVSVGHIPVGADAEALVEALAAALPETEFAPDVLGDCRDTLAGATDLADWFARLLVRWLGHTELALIHPLLPGLRPLTGDLLPNVVTRLDELHAALGRSSEAMRAQGWPLGFEADSDAAFLFYYDDGQRLALHRDGDGFRTRDGERRWTAAELAAEAAQAPESFSFNVMTRPLAQDKLLPTLATVLGPGEIAYQALFREVYEIVGVTQPVVYPRGHITLVEPALRRYLERQGLTAEDACLRAAQKRQELLAAADKLGLPEAFARYREDLKNLHAGIMETVLALDGSLRKTGEENLRQLLVQVDKLQEKAFQQHRKNNEVTLRQLDRLEEGLRPGGLAQERVYNVTSYLARYGRPWLEALSELDWTASQQHWVVEIVPGAAGSGKS